MINSQFGNDERAVSDVYRWNQYVQRVVCQEIKNLSEYGLKFGSWWVSLSGKSLRLCVLINESEPNATSYQVQDLKCGQIKPTLVLG